MSQRPLCPAATLTAHLFLNVANWFTKPWPCVCVPCPFPPLMAACCAFSKTGIKAHLSRSLASSPAGSQGSGCHSPSFSSTSHVHCNRLCACLCPPPVSSYPRQAQVNTCKNGYAGCIYPAGT